MGFALSNQIKGKVEEAVAKAKADADAAEAKATEEKAASDSTASTTEAVAAVPTRDAVEGVRTSIAAPSEAPTGTEEAIKENLNDPEGVLQDKGLTQEAVTLDPNAPGTEMLRTPDMAIPIPGDITPITAATTKVQDTAIQDVTKIQDDEIQRVGENIATAAELGDPEDAEAAADVIAQDFEVETIDPSEIARSLDAIRNESPMVAASMTTEMNLLLDAMESGDIPAWAKPAVTQVEKTLAARGISASSVGRDALFNAIIQSAMPIAQTNAQFKQEASQTTYNATVQAILTDTAAENAARQFNASSINQKNQFMSGLRAQVDTQNAQRKDAISQFNAASANDFAKTRASLETEVALTNVQLAQQAEVVNVTELNRAALFNATAQNEAARIATAEKNLNTRFNADAANKASEFNAMQANSLTQFTAGLVNNVNQFNSNQSLVIQQSNTQWRRQANTSNTAIENQVNMTNTMNAFNLNNQALSFLWQAERDEASWFEQATQNDLDRMNRLEATVLGNEAGAAAEKGKLFANILTAVGKFVIADKDMD